eukprot:TRINITY_DN2138_c0_g1_i1.p1 TRINITY_DN2138_c0_g1~~TRINITY_DN2138_c0_g1_i1.p1  ORF type:complete len:349 (+),score=69.95 TRINITY_DN2138_c0_g1_i1:181-1227(+)
MVETLLHEMIHAYLFVTHNNKDREGHGPEFIKHMERLNRAGGYNITVYHSFTQEVDYYRLHHWQCEGKCKKLVKRAMNRAPGKHDVWWSRHESYCGGEFKKIKEPPPKEKKPKKDKKKIKDLIPSNKLITNYFSKDGEESKGSGKRSREESETESKEAKKIGKRKREDTESKSKSKSTSSKSGKRKRDEETKSEYERPWKIKREGTNAKSKSESEQSFKRGREEAETRSKSESEQSGRGRQETETRSKSESEQSEKKQQIEIREETETRSKSESEQSGKRKREQIDITGEDDTKETKGTSTMPIFIEEEREVTVLPVRTGYLAKQVTCPVCHTRVALGNLNDHLDSCL